MAADKIKLGTTDRAKIIKDAVQRIRQGLNDLGDQAESMTHMRVSNDAAGSQIIVDEFAVAAAPAATALEQANLLFNELNSAKSNSAALRQFLALVG